jgi:hypothetical protein
LAEQATAIRDAVLPDSQKVVAWTEVIC